MQRDGYKGVFLPGYAKAKSRGEVKPTGAETRVILTAQNLTRTPGRRPGRSAFREDQRTRTSFVDADNSSAVSLQK